MSSQDQAKIVWKGTAVLVIKKDKITDFKKAVSKIINPTLREKGCLGYEGYQVVDEDGQETNRFEFHEIWDTKETMLIDHKENSPHMKAFFAEINADTENSYLESFEVGGKTVKVLDGV
jgi:quinol monooxygenase YgiN